jgi:hypothetical protein
MATVQEVNGTWQQCMRLMGRGNSDEVNETWQPYMRLMGHGSSV